MIALTPHREEIHRNLGIIYQHTALEWVNITADFWKKRLGKMESGIREAEEMGRKYSDMHIRFILDNFNCLSFNEQGDLLTNWQGAPSHSLSRLWGIDIEPDVVSVMYAVPEVGPRAIEYLVKRNAPRFSLYSDHSIFFYIAPLLIAGKYLELTGDADYFKNHPDVTAGLEEVYQGMLAHKHKEHALFTSHYASDLIVFKKYDYGANVQCYYALKSWCVILEQLGRDTTEALQILKRMPEDMAAYMEADGPFGKQITGGNNLEENQDRFYIPDDIYYYGGEDTATVLAPLYGLYEFEYEPYVNLHRFARSMYITSYDPEFQTMRELHFGMNPSATGCTLRLGGSYTRKEMLKTLGILYDRLDETGSLFWWPRAYNKKRCLTRCSQGQGAWVQQSIEQWYGLRMDALHHTLTIKPQGLLSFYHLEGVRLGNFVFDIEYEEKEGETRFRVKNKNRCDLKVQFVVRPFGAGAQGNRDTMITDQAKASDGETIERVYQTVQLETKEAEIEKQECIDLSEQGVLFAPYGIVMPKLSFNDCQIFLLRFVISHLEKTWKNVKVELKLPDRWKAAEKKYYMWDYQPVFRENSGKAICEVGELEANTHGVAGFYVNLPDELIGGEKSVMLSEHPFPQSIGKKMKAVTLYVEGGKSESLEPMTAILTADGEEKARYQLPVQILSRAEYEQKFDEMYHGKQKS